MRRCVEEEEQQQMLQHCHAASYGGHFGGVRTATKVLQSGYYQSTLFKDAHELVKMCGRCQRTGNTSNKHEMSLTNILD